MQCFKEAGQLWNKVFSKERVYKRSQASADILTELNIIYICKANLYLHNCKEL